MENTRIMLQQPVGGLQGSADECNITATELNRNMKVGVAGFAMVWAGECGDQWTLPGECNVTAAT